MASRIVATLFGRFGLADQHSGAALVPRSRKAAALVACVVASAPRTVSRDRLMSLLWSERGEEQARGSLRQALAEIRAGPLGPATAIDRREIGLVQGAIQTDAERIAEAAGAHDLPALAEMMPGLDDHVLDGLDDLDPAYDDWLRDARQQIVDRLTHDVVAACTGAPDPGDPAMQRTILSTLQRINPIEEAGVRLCMALDHRAGDLASLHRRYRALTETLRRTFDAEPSAETVALFRRLTAVAPVRDQPHLDRAAAAPPIEPPVIILLPLELAGADAQDAMLASICLADVEVALGGIADLRLLSLDDPSPAALEAACGVSVASYVLRGSFLAGDEVRLSWRLHRIEDGMLIWSHRMAERRDNLGHAMDDIVSRVAGAVLPAVERDIDHRPITRGSAGGSGYDCYLRGRALHLSEGGLDAKREAADYYEQAIARAPRLVNAHLNLARLYNTDFEQLMAGHDPAPLRAKAFDLCARAVAIDPRSAQARARLGWCYMRRGDTRQSRQRFHEALVLSPFHADCLNELGFGLCHLGDLDEGGRLLALAFELNPFPKGDYFCDMGVMLMLRGEHAAAEEQFEVSAGCARHYAAFRLANRGLLGRRRFESECEALRESCRAIWVDGHDPGDPAILALILQYVPLQVAAHREMLARGLAQAGMAVAA